MLIDQEEEAYLAETHHRRHRCWGEGREELATGEGSPGSPAAGAGSPGASAGSGHGRDAREGDAGSRHRTERDPSRVGNFRNKMP
jgi:hypothetical protein